MKNTILNYDTEELELELNEPEVVISDYFSKDVGIYNIFDTLDDYIDIYQISNNDKLERIALELYGNSDYWDVLLLLNDRNPMFEMPYDYDLLEDYSEERTNYFANVIYSHPILSPNRLAALKAEILATSVDDNEDYRLIYIIKPEKMNTFISLLKTEEYL